MAVVNELMRTTTEKKLLCVLVFVGFCERGRTVANGLRAFPTGIEPVTSP